MCRENCKCPPECGCHKVRSVTDDSMKAQPAFSMGQIVQGATTRKVVVGKIVGLETFLEYRFLVSFRYSVCCLLCGDVELFDEGDIHLADSDLLEQISNNIKGIINGGTRGQM